MTTQLTFKDMTFIDSSWAAITVWGGTLDNCSFDNVTVTGGPHVGEVNSANGKMTFTNTVASGLTSTGTETCDSGFSFVYGAGCSGWDTTCCNCW